MSLSSPDNSGAARPAGRPDAAGALSAKARSLRDRLSAAPAQRDKLGVALFPDRLIIARVGGWRRQLKHKEIIEFAPADAGAASWRPALDALAGQVRAGAFAAADVTVVLSSHFVRYVLVPWSDVLSGEEEQLAFARHRFSRVYGSAADGWALKVSDANPRQPRLASGVEQGLIDALNEAMAPVGGRYRSLQPHLMASFNRWHAQLGVRPGWFVVAERGLLCLTLLQDGQWQSVRTIKVGADWQAELAGALDREQCLVDSQTECHQVMLFAPDGPAAAPSTTGRWQIELLRPGLPLGMVASGDARFSIVIGA